MLLLTRGKLTDLLQGLHNPGSGGGAGIAGIPKQMSAHSGVDKEGKGLVGNGNQNFEYQTLHRKDGVLIQRNTDSEYKILDNLADKLGSNTLAKRTVTIFTERPACGSCLGVVEQLQQRYSGIQVNVLDNNGALLTPRKK